eukprot:1152549-Pelagomonas_calceolata.AAC.6
MEEEVSHILTLLHQLMDAAEGHGAHATHGLHILPVHQQVVVHGQQAGGGGGQGGKYAGVLEDCLQATDQKCFHHFQSSSRHHVRDIMVCTEWLWVGGVKAGKKVCCSPGRPPASSRPTTLPPFSKQQQTPCA